MTRKRRTRGKGRARRQAPRAQKKGVRFVDLAVIAMLGLAIYFAVFGGEYSIFGLRKLEALERQRAAEVARIQAELDSLRALEAELRNDPQAIERVARERYGMIREGEILYRFREAVPEDAPPKPEEKPGDGADGPE